jgi:Ca-activated chloride channel family protein
MDGRAFVHATMLPASGRRIKPPHDGTVSHSIKWRPLFCQTGLGHRNAFRVTGRGVPGEMIPEGSRAVGVRSFLRRGRFGGYGVTKGITGRIETPIKGDTMNRQTWILTLAIQLAVAGLIFQGCESKAPTGPAGDASAIADDEAGARPGELATHTPGPVTLSGEARRREGAHESQRLLGKSSVSEQASLDPSISFASAQPEPGLNGRDLGQDGDWNREAYDHITENAFAAVTDHPLSTFSIDVDTASYSNARRYLTHGSLPPAGAVRIEEMINYFPYQYSGPDDEHPFAVHTESTACPWNTQHRLVRIGIQGRKVDREKRSPANLVFLLDVSGSMNSPDKLGLVKTSMKMLLENLRKDDRVGIVVYAGSSGLVLDSTPGSEKDKIVAALDRLSAGGSTNGGAGIQLAYKVAGENFIKGGVNRVILCTDGDFNVGTTDRGGLVKMAENKAKGGVFLTVLGFGTGNLNDAMMEELTNKGNGNYGYVDSEREARKLLVEQLDATMITIAKDVKIQVEFNPARVNGYRLIGYENRMLKKEDFNDDTKDAGEIGAGHCVTALYEVVPAGVKLQTPKVDELKYQKPSPVIAEEAREDKASEEMLTVKIRYKQPEADKSVMLARPFTDDGKDFARASEDLRFAASVAAFGMILRDSKFAGGYTLGAVAEVAESSCRHDPHEYRKEFVELVKTAAQLKKM